MKGLLKSQLALTLITLVLLASAITVPLSGSITRSHAQAAPTVTATISVGFQPQGIGADPNTDTIYVANQSDNTVSVIDGRTNTVTATVPVGLLPLKVATDPHTDTAYVINGASNTVSVISGR